MSFSRPSTATACLQHRFEIQTLKSRSAALLRSAPVDDFWLLEFKNNNLVALMPLVMGAPRPGHPGDPLASKTSWVAHPMRGG